MPGLVQLWRSGRENSQADFIGQSNIRRERERGRHRQRSGGGKCLANLLALVNRALHGATPVAAMRLAGRILGSAREKFEAGDGFKRAMQRRWQPEGQRQNGKNVSQTPHGGY